MSTAELISLEREVEAARERVAGDLARLRSPATLSEFKSELLTEAWQSKDQIVGSATNYVEETLQSVLADIKGRAAANPAAALAIGAGLAWQLLRHPPIASLLVGAGVYGLMKTRPSPDLDFASGLAAQANDVATTVKDQVQEWGVQAGEAVRETASQASGNIAALAERASVAMGDAGAAARRSAAELASDAAATGRSASAVISDAMPEPHERDQLLLGAAALAIAAAVGIASQRRPQQGG
jgi:hypothetical protein